MLVPNPFADSERSSEGGLKESPSWFFLLFRALPTGSSACRIWPSRGTTGRTNAPLGGEHGNVVLLPYDVTKLRDLVEELKIVARSNLRKLSNIKLGKTPESKDFPRKY